MHFPSSSGFLLPGSGAGCGFRVRGNYSEAEASLSDVCNCFMLGTQPSSELQALLRRRLMSIYSWLHNCTFEHSRGKVMSGCCKCQVESALENDVLGFKVRARNKVEVIISFLNITAIKSTNSISYAHTSPDSSLSFDWLTWLFRWSTRSSEKSQMSQRQTSHQHKADNINELLNSGRTKNFIKKKKVFGRNNLKILSTLNRGPTSELL